MAIPACAPTKAKKAKVKLNLTKPDAEKYGEMPEADVKLAKRLAGAMAGKLSSMFAPLKQLPAQASSTAIKGPPIKKGKTRVSLNLTKPDPMKYGDMEVGKGDVQLAKLLATAVKDRAWTDVKVPGKELNESAEKEGKS